MQVKQDEGANKIIPRQDLINVLPIRWAFHCSNDDGSPRSPQWHFPEWRDYLMEPTLEAFDGHIHNIRHILYNKGTDQTFPQMTKDILTYNNARTLVGFIHFWSKCCREYKELLIEHSII